jgi:DNA-binding Lrp family transcriptional regulator
MTLGERLLLVWFRRHRRADLPLCELAAVVGVSRATAQRAVSRLVRDGMLTRTRHPLATGGRKADVLAMREQPRLFVVRPVVAKPKAATALTRFDEEFGAAWQSRHGHRYIVTNYSAAMTQWQRFCRLVPDVEVRAGVVAAFLDDPDRYLTEHGHPFSAMLVDWRIQGYLLRARQAVTDRARDAVMVEFTLRNGKRMDLETLCGVAGINRYNFMTFLSDVTCTVVGDRIVLAVPVAVASYVERNFLARLSASAGMPVEVRVAS